MKNKNILRPILSIMVVTILLLTSCRKSFFYEGINDDPDQVTKDQLDQSPSVLLNGAEMSIGYTMGGDISRYSSIMDQHIKGAVRQFSSYNNYIFSAQDFNNVWSNIYQGCINNLHTLSEISDAEGYNYYSAVSRVLLAYTYGLTTDLWGDIPRTEAAKGQEGILQPKYDKQEDIYNYLQASLDTAITLLSGAPGSIVPGDDDFIYGGDPSLWTAFANSLKARYYLHLSKIDPSYADKILSVIDDCFTSSQENAAVPFFNDETQANPWYQYIQQRGDISYVNSTYNQMLLSLNDPRSDAYIDQDGDVLTDVIAGIAAPVTLISNTEVLFIKAEALSAKNDAGAATAYGDAVKSAFADAGISMPASYLTDNPLSGATHAQRLPQIIAQKYLALFTQAEPFSDWRRTGFPNLTPNNGANIPRRFLYPQDELDFNKDNVPSSTTLYSKVWWDQ